MIFYIEIDRKIIGELNLMEESLGDFLKKKNLGANFKINRDSTIISLETIKNKNQLKLELK